jgi:hypothetical protein
MMLYVSCFAPAVTKPFPWVDCGLLPLNKPGVKPSIGIKPACRINFLRVLTMLFYFIYKAQWRQKVRYAVNHFPVDSVHDVLRRILCSNVVRFSQSMERFYKQKGGPAVCPQYLVSVKISAKG